jgi:hypothetical protein
MSTSISDDDLRRIRDAVFAGRKIQAIKHYRDCTGIGLKEAKDFVDAVERRLRESDPDQFSVPPGRKGCAAAVLALGIAIGLSAWAWV